MWHLVHTFIKRTISDSVGILPCGLADRALVLEQDRADDPALPVLEHVAVVDRGELVVVLAEDAVAGQLLAAAPLVVCGWKGGFGGNVASVYWSSVHEKTCKITTFNSITVASA